MNKTEELVDLVDAAGQIKKQNIPRSQTNLFPNLYLQIVIVVIFDQEGRVLVHQRALTKSVNPGDIDHVCGGVKAGESFEEAARRETREEAGIELIDLKIVLSGLNTYHRYRTLFVGASNEKPHVMHPDEVTWARFMSLDDLKTKKNSRELSFVGEFFEDTALAWEGRVSFILRSEDLWRDH